MSVKYLKQNMEQRDSPEGLVIVVIVTNLRDFRYGRFVCLFPCLKKRQCFKHSNIWFWGGMGKPVTYGFCFALNSLPND